MYQSVLSLKSTPVRSLTHSCLVDSSISLFGQVHFQIKWCLVCFLVLSLIIEIVVLTANNVDPDRTPRSVASDLGLHCLPMSFLWDASHK